MERKGARRGKDAATRTQPQAAPRAPAPPQPPPPPPARAAAPARPAGAPVVTVRRPEAPAALAPARRAPLAPAAPAAVPRAPAASRAAPIIEAHAGDAEHRHFPRARLAVRFELWRQGEGEGRSFSASLRSVNVSVSGAFLESSFFLPVGTELRVRFELEDDAEPVEARAVIVREQRDAEASGFGVRFEEFYGQTEVALAKLFLGLRLRRFSEEYLQSKRARGLPNELERVVDALAAWELIKATSETDPWRGE